MAGKRYRGGKPDDITVVVAVVCSEESLKFRDSPEYHTSYLTP